MAVQHEIAAVKRSAAKRERANVETIATASFGDVVRQGDLYLVCLERAPKGKRIDSRQLAPGSTQGSRHVAEGDCDVLEENAAEVAASVNRLVKGATIPSELVGPVIHCRGPVTVTHPEHGHKVLPEDSVWAVVYQRAYAEEVRRVQD